MRMSLEARYIRDTIRLAREYENNPKLLLDHIKMLAELYEDDDNAKREIGKIIEKIEQHNEHNKRQGS